MLGMQISKTYVFAMIEALLVTFLWSTSYVLIKIGLREINPLAFAAYRYEIASIILILPVFYRYRLDGINLNLRRILVF